MTATALALDDLASTVALIDDLDAQVGELGIELGIELGPSMTTIRAELVNLRRRIVAIHARLAEDHDRRRAGG